MMWVRCLPGADRASWQGRDWHRPHHTACGWARARLCISASTKPRCSE
jgi:hypothetical protein